MILPNKDIKVEYSLIGCGAVVLSHLSGKKTMSGLWNSICKNEALMNFDKFLLVLDFLFMIDAVEYINGEIVKVHND